MSDETETGVDPLDWEARDAEPTTPKKKTKKKAAASVPPAPTKNLVVVEYVKGPNTGRITTLSRPGAAHLVSLSLVKIVREL